MTLTRSVEDRLVARLAGTYPLADTYHLNALTTEMEALTERVSPLVSEGTGLELPGNPTTAIVGRVEWVQRNVASFSHMFEPVRRQMEERLEKVGRNSELAGRVIEDETSLMLALLSQRVLGQYELVLPGGEPGDTVTYVGASDPDGSINTTSAGKTDFWAHVLALFGVALPADTGLVFGRRMPAGHLPQAMAWDAANGWFVAEGVPITPWDDAGARNPYPLMRLVARNAGGVLATTDVVLPVSDEMDCRTCHASGSGPAGRLSGRRGTAARRTRPTTPGCSRPARPPAGSRGSTAPTSRSRWWKRSRCPGGQKGSCGSAPR